jgi:tetratricopeptide (TPR) repeat protein
MIFKARLTAICAVFLVFAGAALAQIPNQLAQDFVAGRPPTDEEVAQFEKDAAAKPSDLHAVRKLGKAYFFKFFGAGENEFVPKAEKTLERALTIQKDDPEALAYLGSLHVLEGQRIYQKDAAKQKSEYEKGYEMVKKAEALAPTHGAVMSVASATYLYLPDSYGMAPHVVGMLEGMIKGMGPYFEKFSHHGQQRILLALGQAYVRTKQPDKARPLFEKALAVDAKSDEAAMLKEELAKLVKK